MKNKLTIEDIKAKILNENYIVDGTLTICILTLKNGYRVVGTSACTNEDDFNEFTGKTIAYKKAEDKVWELEGYLLKSKLNEQ